MDKQKLITPQAKEKAPQQSFLKNPKGGNTSTLQKQISGICEDLAIHIEVFSMLFKDCKSVKSPIVRGCLESHLEKVKDSLFYIRARFQLKRPIKPLSSQPRYGYYSMEATAKPGQQINLLLTNCQVLITKINAVLVRNKQMGPERKKPLKELLRKLENDLCQTAYFVY